MVVQIEDLLELVKRHIDHDHWLMAMRTLNVIAKECSKRLTEQEKLDFALYCLKGETEG